MSLFDELFSKTDENIQENTISGIVTGIVKEIYNDEYPGMIRVEIRTREKDSNVTDWIKIVTPYAGSDRGIYFLPEVGDEVIVAYYYGNVYQPYVIGSVWNQNSSKLPNNMANENNTIKKIRTKRGHEIIFYEEDGKDDLEIHTPKNLTIKMNDENEVIFIQDKDGKNIIKVDCKKGEINVTAEKKIALESGSSSVTIDNNSRKIAITSDSISIEAKQSLTLKGQSVKMEGAMTEVSASGTMNLKADGPTNLKGAVVKIN